MRALRPLLLAALVAALVPVPAARAGWGPPVPLAPAAQSTRTLGLAVDGAGRPAVLLARRLAHGEVLLLRRGGRDGRLGPPLEIARSRNGFEGAGLFAGRGSDLVAGWLEIVNRARRAVVATGPRLATRQVLSHGRHSTQFMSLAVNPRGEAVAAWWTYTTAGVIDITVALRPPGGRFGAPQIVAEGGLGNPQAAIDADGDAVVAWSARNAIEMAERPAGAARFAAPAKVATADRGVSGPAVAVRDGAVLLAWVVGRPAGSSVVAMERPAAGAPFGAPQTLTSPGVRIPHWVDPAVALDGRHAIVAWVQGVPHTTAHDRAAVVSAPLGQKFGAPVERGVRAPAHVYYVQLLAPAPHRPPILVMTTSHAYRFAAATATVRAGGSLAPTRQVPLGGDGGFRPWLAQGSDRAWLATERSIGRSRGLHTQAVLVAST